VASSVEQFLDVVTFLREQGEPYRSLLDEGHPAALARAPGRLDVMGGIADYSGSLVLELPLAEAAFALVQHRTQGKSGLLRIATLDAPALLGGTLGESRFVTLSLREVLADSSADYHNVRELFRRSGQPWAAYLGGVVAVLARERGLGLDEHSGEINLILSSAVPPGAGVSSSAAVEVASLSALSRACGEKLEAVTLGLYCQRAENFVAGAPCGVMDQLTAACGQQGSLLELLCQPATLLGNVALPSDLQVWGIDSRLRHAVGGSDYGAVRVAAFMGYRIISEQLGFPVLPLADGRVRIEDAQFNGYLANIPPSLFDERFDAELPERLSGAEFLRRYGGTTDSVTRVDPLCSYAVRAATRHPVYEHQRAKAFRVLLDAKMSPARNHILGELMYQSHHSYNVCGLGSEGTDLLVRWAKAADPSLIFGAKITGGGSGGTVAILGRPEAGPEVQALAERYTRETGREARVFSGSSPGAAAFGTMTVRAKNGRWLAG
jgi:galactokinase